MSISTDILASLSQQLGAGYDKMKAQMQTEADYLEKQSMMIANGRVNGQIPDDQYNWLLGNLRTDSENFCRILCMQTLLTIEAAWNAVVGIVWDAINAILSAHGLGALTMPTAPAA